MSVGHFLCGVAWVKRYVNVYLHLYRQQPEMDNQNVDITYPEKIVADAHACVICVYNLTSALHFAMQPFLCYLSTLCSSLSVSVSLNVRFTTNGICSKTCNHIYVARTNEGLSPYICNVCEFLGTNYCMSTKWLTGPLQKIPSLAQTSRYAIDCGGRHFSTRPGAALPHVGALATTPSPTSASFWTCALKSYKRIVQSLALTVVRASLVFSTNVGCYLLELHHIPESDTANGSSTSRTLFLACVPFAQYNLPAGCFRVSVVDRDSPHKAR